MVQKYIATATIVPVVVTTVPVVYALLLVSNSPNLALQRMPGEAKNNMTLKYASA